MRANDNLSRLLSNWSVKILSVAAAVVLYLFYRIGSLEERYFSVPIALYVSDDFVATEISSRSARVNLRGSEDEIFLILEGDVEAYVDVAEHESEGLFRSPILVRKSGSAETAEVEIKVDPLEAIVTLERKITRELEVTPEISGYPATGFELVQYLITPNVVEIVGPRTRIDAIVNLKTTEIDLTGKTEDFTLRLPVVISEDMVEIVGSPNVEVHGIIREAIVRRTFEVVSIRYINLASPLERVGGPTNGSLRLTGPQLIIESLRSIDLSLVVDCGQVIEAGVFDLAVEPQIPGGVAVVSYQPSVVNLQMSLVETETAQ